VAAEAIADKLAILVEVGTANLIICAITAAQFAQIYRFRRIIQQRFGHTARATTQLVVTTG
jgi:hypothetical protein